MNDAEHTDLRRLLDRQAILDCLYRYTRGIDRLDRDLALSAYHPDAIDDHGVFVGSPVDFIDWVFPLMRSQNTQLMTNHLLSNHSCELTGDSAHCETHYLFFGVNEEGTIDVVGGRYIDRMQRRDGDWRIFRRLCATEWFGSLNDGAHADPTMRSMMKLLLSNGHRSRDRGDISYMRPLSITRPSKDYSRGG
jgi:hypothetical protein